MAIVLNLPWAVHYTIQPNSVEKGELLECFDEWNLEEPETAKKYFLIVNIACFYVVPVVITVAANVVTWSRVKDRKFQHETRENTVEVIHQRTRRNVCTILTIVTITFFVAWTFYYTLVLAQLVFDVDVPESLFCFIVWMAWSTSSLNPIVYGLLSSNFRKMFKSLLPSCYRRDALPQNQ